MTTHSFNSISTKELQNHLQQSKTFETESFFGPLQFEAEQIIKFPQGLFGFPASQEYILGPFPKSHHKSFKNFFLLQCLHKKNVAFILFPLMNSHLPYTSKELDQVLEKGFFTSENTSLFAITTFSQTEETITAMINLKAPVVIDFKQLQGMQYVFEDSSYPLQEKLATYKK